MLKNIEKGIRVTTWFMRFYSLICAFLVGAWCFGLAGRMWQHPDIFTVEPWYEFCLGILLLSASIYGYILSNHRISLFILAPVAVYGISEMIYTPYIRLNRVFTAWEVFGIVQSIYGILLIIGIIVSLIHYILISLQRFKERKETHIEKPYFKRFTELRSMVKTSLATNKRIHIAFISILIISSFFMVGLEKNWFIPSNAVITLHPENKSIKFQFYGPDNITFYNQTQLDSLNALGVRIIGGVTDFITYTDYIQDPYLWWLNLTDYKQTQDYKDKRDQIVNMFMPWKENESNITFLYWLHGVPSGLPTDYSVTSGYWGVGALILNAWLTAEVIVENNLTNVVGFHTDQESVSDNEAPFNGYTNNASFEVTRDFERNMQARENYLEFFNRLRYAEQTNATWITFMNKMNELHGIDHLLFTTTYENPLVIDGLDSDWDMETFNINNVNTLPYDEFLPMLYTQSDFPADQANYALYTGMRTLADTLQTAGYPERIGALLGCMGSKDSMFAQNYTGSQYLNGKEQPANGFDIIARQVMILKSFNCTWASFFPLNAYGDIVGIYLAYSSDFFDRLNVTVNGPGSANSFDIRFYPAAGNGDIDLARDIFLSTDWTWYYAIVLLGSVIIVSIHQKNRAKIISKKIESEN
jgi:hypothetical protein